MEMCPNAECCHCRGPRGSGGSVASGGERRSSLGHRLGGASPPSPVPARTAGSRASAPASTCSSEADGSKAVILPKRSSEQKVVWDFLFWGFLFVFLIGSWSVRSGLVQDWGDFGIKAGRAWFSQVRATGPLSNFWSSELPHLMSRKPKGRCTGLL